jgi:hypothetical protein
MKDEKCDWKYDDIDDFYQGSCGVTWSLCEGTLEENKMNFCPQCGKKIKLVK